MKKGLRNYKFLFRKIVRTNYKERYVGISISDREIDEFGFGDSRLYNEEPNRCSK